MFTSDIDLKRSARHCLTGYGAAVAFCFLFQLVYEHYAHGVISYYMVFAFLIPLAGGLVSLLSLRGEKGKDRGLFRQFICGSVIWFTLGSIFQGILEIYGTTNRMSIVFVIAGLAELIAAGISVWFADRS